MEVLFSVSENLPWFTDQWRIQDFPGTAAYMHVLTRLGPKTIILQDVCWKLYEKEINWTEIVGARP